MVPADCISLFDAPQCSHRKDITIISRKYGIEVRSMRVIPYWYPGWSEVVIFRKLARNAPARRISYIDSRSPAWVYLHQSLHWLHFQGAGQPCQRWFQWQGKVVLLRRATLWLKVEIKTGFWLVNISSFPIYSKWGFAWLRLSSIVICLYVYLKYRNLSYIINF